MVEFALVLLPLAIIVFGTIDLGRAYSTSNQVKNAARRGAAYAQSNPLAQRQSGSSCADPENIEYQAQSETGSRRTDFVVTIVPAVAGGCVSPSSTQPINPGDTITVTVAKTFQLLTPLIQRIVGTPTISASVNVVVQG